MTRRNYSRVIKQLAARAAHRVIHAQPACHVRIEQLRHGQHFVQRDQKGGAYPALDLRRCWRPNGVLRTPLLSNFND